MGRPEQPRTALHLDNRSRFVRTRVAADAAQRGTVDVKAAYDGAADTLAVTVDDRGRWRHQAPVPFPQQMRGRGIPLMEALADDTVIDRTPRGTRVTLTWTELTRPA